MKYIKLFESFDNDDILDEIKQISQEISDLDDYDIEIKMINPSYKYFTYSVSNKKEEKSGPLIEIYIVNPSTVGNSNTSIVNQLQWSYNLKNPHGKYHKDYMNFRSHLKSFCQEHGLDMIESQHSVGTPQRLIITIIPNGYPMANL